MFKRREKLSWKKRLSGYLWPQGGWKRYGQFILLKLHRLGGTPRSIAAGFACGAAISFTPFVGFHMILAAATAFLLSRLALPITTATSCMPSRFAVALIQKPAFAVDPVFSPFAP